MKNVISIQSHVVYGTVGNKSAVLPLQLLGVDVWPIHTVQYSNHTQLKQWTGMKIPDEQIIQLAQGLDNIHMLEKCDAVLSGYIISEQQGLYIVDLVNKVKQKNPQAVYLCDPVMSNASKGKFVTESIVDFFTNNALTVADYLAPNVHELGLLTQMNIVNFNQALKAVENLLDKGIKKVLVKHLAQGAKDPTKFEMLLATAQGIWHITRPLYDCVNKHPVGVGDLISAIFLGNLLNGYADVEAFERTNNAVSDIMQYTANSHEFELQIVGARDYVANPKSTYSAIKIA